MSDPIVPEPTPEPTAESVPAAPATPAAPPAPAAPAAPAYAPVAAAPAQGLSLTSFILGLAGFVLAWFAGLGFLPGLAAIIISVIAHKREPQAPRWMTLIGLIAGIVAIVIGFIVFLVVLFATLLPLWLYGTAVTNLPGY